MVVYKGSVHEMWQKYRAEHPMITSKFEAWSFGNSARMANELGGLVMDGIKTGTATCSIGMIKVGKQCHLWVHM